MFLFEAPKCQDGTIRAATIILGIRSCCCRYCCCSRFLLIIVSVALVVSLRRCCIDSNNRRCILKSLRREAKLTGRNSFIWRICEWLWAKKQKRNSETSCFGATKRRRRVENQKTNQSALPKHCRLLTFFGQSDICQVLLLWYCCHACSSDRLGLSDARLRMHISDISNWFSDCYYEAKQWLCINCWHKPKEKTAKAKDRCY